VSSRQVPAFRRLDPRKGDRLRKGEILLGGYAFPGAYLAEAVPRILSGSAGPEGAGEGELALEEGISRGAVKEILRSLEEQGRGTLVRSRFYSGGDFREKSVSPFEREILRLLREAGEKGLDARFLKIRGGGDALAALSGAGLAVRMEEEFYWSLEVLEAASRRLLDNRKAGDRMTIAEAREASGLSRRLLLPLLGRMEEEGTLRREGNDRVVTGHSGGVTAGEVSSPGGSEGRPPQPEEE